MESSNGAATPQERDSSQCVRVAVNVRPLITAELLNGCTDCITVVPGEPQTGSGKTYTMGTNYNGDESSGGIIPRVMEAIFHYVETMKDSSEFLIRVSFIEIFKEEVFDLLDSSPSISKVEGAHPSKIVGAARIPIQIRETVTGGITLAGVTEAEVRSREEMTSYLLRVIGQLKINRDPMADQLQRMRSQIEQLQSEILFYRGDVSAPFEELQLLKHKVSLLEASNMELQRELQERKISCDYLAGRAINAQVEKDKLIMQIESARNGKSWDDIDTYPDKEYDLINNYVSKIQELEGELLRLQNLPHPHYRATESTDSDVDGLNVTDGYFTCLNELSSHPSGKDLYISDYIGVKEKEMEHSDLQEKLGMELKELDEKLEEKEKEIEELRGNLANISSASDDGAQKLKEEYLQKLNFLEAQLKKEGRKNEYEMHKLLALNQRQKMALMQAIEHELEVTVRVHEVRSAYEHQMEERSKMAKEIARLKEEAQMQRKAIVSNFPQGMSPGARNSRIFALENMLSSSSGALVSMASQLSEAEECEKRFSGRGRWNQVRSLAEAKNLMNYLFNIASSSRCQLRDKEVDCREKDSEIQDLKEKVVKLSTVIRQMEMQKAEAELIQQNMLMKEQEKTVSSGGSDTSFGTRSYSLRRQELRNSIHVPEDMDTSESEVSDCDNPDDDDGEWPVCSCSAKSQCKTSKCECRSMGAVCGASCGCTSTVCNNRETHANVASATTDYSPKEDSSEKPSELISQGASLLQSAFGEKPVAQNTDDNGSKRKPLSDIGNKPVRPDDSKRNRRKKWGKKVAVQLVPVAPPPADQPKTTSSEDVKKPDESIAINNGLPLKLPRAMRARGPGSVSTNNTLRERNNDPPRSPPRRVPTSDEKENLR
ncbi:hypothetical protein SAY86_011733 [Trapa natans]|uniref:Kinesin motor domain-containing protein n=1 Tax=Trapa natans TaxID=22666 RepID=A0AAN7LW75_TRANT|nr:hypothetical protein SAY86_011733 [Trapa natans]